MCNCKCGTVFQIHLNKPCPLSAEKWGKRNTLYNGIEQPQQMAITDQQTKINQNSYKFGKTRFPFVKACLCKYI